MPLSPEQQAEIDAQRAQPRTTLRTVSEGMEKHLYLAHPVLDHGFVRAIDYMGDDAAIVQAARVSYGAGTKHVSNDEGLIRYLMRHWHSTPFEMCEIKLHVKLPVFVARQWIRHRTANVNEYSARYSILDREFYIPAPEHLAAQSSVNNQGRGEVLEGEEAQRVLALLREDARLRGREDDFSHEAPLRRCSYRRRGDYAAQLDALYAHFPREQVLLLRSTELAEDPAACLLRVCVFLGLPPPPELPAFDPVFVGDYTALRPGGLRWRLLSWWLRRELAAQRTRHGLEWRP